MFTEYHKIESLYARDLEGSKKLMYGEFRSETIKSIKDTVWFATEKVDGTNIRVYWDGHTVKIGGRTDKACIPTKLYDYLHSKFLTPEAEETFETMVGEKEVLLYGEGYGAGIQKCGKDYRDDNAFILFDVLFEGKYWGDRFARASFATAFNVPVVPVVCTGTIKDIEDFVKTKPISQISQSRDLVMEGVVAVPEARLKDKEGRRIITKIKVRDYEDMCV